ncbi:MAG: metallophosphoesterase family protein [Caldiserica bacterium]|nr:metallophosphoesterase family protein [Caldisericota bacterium]
MDKKWIFLAVLITIGLLAAVGLFRRGPMGEGFPPALVRGPWTSAVGDAVIVSFQLDPPAGGEVLYGPADEGPVAAAAFSPVDGPVHVRLAGLEPGTRYVYRIALADGSRTPPGRFVTPPEGFTPFTFLVYGDTRTFYDRHRIVADRMAEEDAAFVVHTGDLIESPMEGEWDAFFSSGRRLFLSALFFPVLGNHERNSLSYYRLFELPGAGGKKGEQWWSFRWGDVLFVGLDSNTQYLQFTGLRAETEWLKEVLSQDARFKFVFFHHPLYSSDLYYGGNEGLAKLWHPIFVETGVDIVFCGHVHAYEHIVRDGVHYVTTGGGGAPAYPLGEPVEGGVFSAQLLLHYMRVRVTRDAAEVEMVPVARVPLGEEEGEVVPVEAEPLERFTVEARSPVPQP